MKKKSLALFDFDGTVTSKDSLFAFLVFSRGWIRFILGMLFLSPVLAAFKLGLVQNWKAKELLLTYFFKDMSEPAFQQLCTRFTAEVIPRIIRKKARERIESHVREGDRVVIVSASPENWVGLWAREYDLEWVATRLRVDAGKLTGKFSGKNCHGMEKVARVRVYLNLSEYHEIYTYGDSKGDLPLINLGTKKYYKPFRD